MSEEPASSSSSKMEVCVVCRDRRVQIQIGGREVGLGWTLVIFTQMDYGYNVCYCMLQLKF